MPLSEEELRLLEQMERALVAEDPKLASTLRGTRMRKHARRQMAVGILAFIVGVAVLMSGAVLHQTLLGIAGFVVMLGAAYFTLVSWRGQNRATPLVDPRHPSADPSLRVVQGGKAGKKSRNRAPKQHSNQGTLMERFEERWRRRREQNGGL